MKKKIYHIYPCGHKELIKLNDYESKHNSYYFMNNKKLVECGNPLTKSHLDPNYKYFSVRGLELSSNNNFFCKDKNNNYHKHPDIDSECEDKNNNYHKHQDVNDQ